MSEYRTRKSRRADLSQHFLRSPALASSLVRQAGLASSDLVIEIGPGLGTLTTELARSCRKVIAVEVDPVLLAGLKRRFADDTRVSLVRGDFLDFALPNEGAYKVFGNIPYNRTAAIVRRVTTARSAPSDVHLVMQREAAERFAGAPFGAETLQSLLLKPTWHVEIVRELRRVDFDPPPRVVSVMIGFARRGRPLVTASEQGRYRAFVSECFGRRGKTIQRCVKRHITRSQLRRVSRLLRFDPSAPPSALSFDQWLGLFRFTRWHGGTG